MTRYIPLAILLGLVALLLSSPGEPQASEPTPTPKPDDGAAEYRQALAEHEDRVAEWESKVADWEAKVASYESDRQQAARAAALARHEYSAHHAEAQDTGRLVVLVSADWCRYCPQAKDALDAAGESYAIVDADTPKGAELLRGRALPCLVTYTRTDGEWRAKRHVGVGEIRNYTQPARGVSSQGSLFCWGCR